MYWNRDIFSAAGIANLRKIGASFSIFSEKAYARDPQSGDISQSGVALGGMQTSAREKDPGFAFPAVRESHRVWNARIPVPMSSFSKRPDLADLCSEFLYAVLESDPNPSILGMPRFPTRSPCSSRAAWAYISDLLRNTLN